MHALAKRHAKGEVIFYMLCTYELRDWDVTSGFFHLIKKKRVDFVFNRCSRTKFRLILGVHRHSIRSFLQVHIE